MIIGVTSWQVPGTYLDNIRLLKNKVDFVELLVYTWDSDTMNLLSLEIDEIEKEISFSVHLPTDKIENVYSAFNFFEKYKPLRLTLHPFEPFDEFAQLVEEGYSIFKENLCIENLENNLFFETYDKLKIEPSITMDYGHLLLTSNNPENFIKKYRNKIVEIHYHSVDGKKDHQKPSGTQVKDFLDLYGKYFGKSLNMPVVIETFKIEDTLATVEEIRNAERYIGSSRDN